MSIMERLGVISMTPEDVQDACQQAVERFTLISVLIEREWSRLSPRQRLIAMEMMADDWAEMTFWECAVGGGS
jgi:hypothetical protein